MAVSEPLVSRVRELASNHCGIAEKKMFGCAAFLVDGSMSVGVHEDELIVRLSAADAAAALEQPGVRAFDLAGRPMKGWVLVSGPAIASAEGLAVWVARGLAWGATQPKRPGRRHVAARPDSAVRARPESGAPKWACAHRAASHPSAILRPSFGTVSGPTARPGSTFP